MTSPPSPRSASRRAGQGARASARAPRRPASAPPRPAALAACVARAAGCGGGDEDAPASLQRDRFDAAAAFELIERQVAYGTRPAGSPELRRLAAELRPQLPQGRFEPLPGGLRNVIG